MHTGLRATTSSAAPGAAPATTWVLRLRAAALAGLPRMYRPDEGLFAFTLRGPTPQRRAGRSARYTAIVLLGLRQEDPADVRRVLHGTAPEALCGRLIDCLPENESLGDTALIAWAAAAWQHPRAARAQAWLVVRLSERKTPYCVDLAWALAALGHDPRPAVTELAGQTAARLRAVQGAGGLFPHWVGKRRSLRAHVACFADQVYPIHALSEHSRRAGAAADLHAAQRCAARICALLGPAGQWWWHYDVRSGRVLEPYPVYAVHQHAMAPLALLALRTAGGPDLSSYIGRGLAWLRACPELDGGSLVDGERELIWRKVARREPVQLARRVQALASRVHPQCRVPLDWALRPTAIDYEVRPYELGWLLYAWGPAQAAAWSGEDRA
jgi:hypothetical protein